MPLREYASHLRRHHLEALTAEHLRLVKSYETPIARRLSHLSAPEQLALSRAGLEQFLTEVASDDARPVAEESLRRWQKNDLAGLDQGDLQPGDLVWVYAAKKQALLHLLPTFAQDPHVLVGLVQELETHFTRVQLAAVRAVTERRTERVRLAAKKDAPLAHVEELRPHHAELPARHEELEQLHGELRRISEHVDAEVARRTKACRQFEFLVHDITDFGIYMLDPIGRITSWNKGAGHFKGYEEAEILGSHFSRFYPPEARAEGVPDRLLSQALAEGQARDENWRLRKDGTRFWAEVVVTPVHDDTGAFIGFSKITRDLTERRRAQDLAEIVSRRTQELAEKNAALHQAIAELRQVDRYKDEFLSVISHELRTPLNFITGFASILADEAVGPLNEVQIGYLDKILRGADRMLALVNNLLDVGRMQAGKFQLVALETDFRPLVHEVIASLDPLAADKQLEIAMQVEVPTRVPLDGARITQVVTNLLDNAIKFTPEGGRVQVVARLEGDRLVTEITDSGPGIAEADIGKLFSPFKQLDMGTTRRVGGSGLGLSICKAIVEAHGGSIGLRSRLGEGSTFWFSLPLRGGIGDAGTGGTPSNARA